MRKRIFAIIILFLVVMPALLEGCKEANQASGSIEEENVHSSEDGYTEPAEKDEQDYTLKVIEMDAQEQKETLKKLFSFMESCKKVLNGMADLGAIDEDTLHGMIELGAKEGLSVTCGNRDYNLTNYEKVDDALKAALAGKDAKAEFYQVNTVGVFRYYHISFVKGELSVPSIMPVLGKLQFGGIFSLNFIVVIFAFLFVDMFDTIGTLIGVASKADMLDEEGKLPRIKGALMADAVATTAGAVLGTTTTTTFVESASGVTEGGKTGLTAVTTAVLFGLALFLSPIFLAIPSFATAPALIVVGFYMLTNVANIDFSDISEALPCYICIAAMPFFYSISEGISMGVISYVALNLVTGKGKEKKISVLMYVLAVLFILKYIFL